jgi:hypothetical protein
MSKYTEFVRANMSKAPANLAHKDKMRWVASQWRKGGHAGKVMKGGCGECKDQSGGGRSRKGKKYKRVPMVALAGEDGGDINNLAGGKFFRQPMYMGPNGLEPKGTAKIRARNEAFRATPEYKQQQDNIAAWKAQRFAEKQIVGANPATWGPPIAPVANPPVPVAGGSIDNLDGGDISNLDGGEISNLDGGTIDNLRGGELDEEDILDEMTGGGAGDWREGLGSSVTLNGKGFRGRGPLLYNLQGGGPISSVLSVFGLGAPGNLRGGDWMDDLKSGFSTGASIAGSVLPFIL